MSGEKILLVDDEQDIVELLEYNLLKEGYQVRTASNGKEALKKSLMNKGLIIIVQLAGFDLAFKG